MRIEPGPLCSLEPNWWVFALQGLLSLAFGVLAALVPVTAALVLTVVFGVYAILDGLLFLVAGLRRARKGAAWGGLVAYGTLGILAGLTVLIVPRVAALGLSAFLWTLISVWAMATGLSALSASVRLRREVKGERLMALRGALSLLLGAGMLVLLLLNPMASVATLGLFIAVNAMISGFLLLLLGQKLQRLGGASFS